MKTSRLVARTLHVFTRRRCFSLRVKCGALEVEEVLHRAINGILKGTGVSDKVFWTGLEDVLRDLTPKNLSLLSYRESLQKELDVYHANTSIAQDIPAYKEFLARIGYLKPAPTHVAVRTENVDPEISLLCGPQLVVPGDNARFALNAANARWGSLLGAYANTDAIEPKSSQEGSDHPDHAARAANVMDALATTLDSVFPLTKGLGFAEACDFQVTEDGKLVCQGAFPASSSTSPAAVAAEAASLVDEAAFVGFTGPPANPSSVLLKHNGLHMELLLGSGRGKKGVVKDVSVEAALSAIVDFEDSVAAVDGSDKAVLYANWAGLLAGTLEVQLGAGKEVRRLHRDKTFTVPGHAGGYNVDNVEGGELTSKTLTLKGRCVLLVRHVGLHMFTSAVTMNHGDGKQVPVLEGILDAFATTAGALPKLATTSSSSSSSSAGLLKNSECGSVYVVKPKMHGADEVQFTVELLGKVEDAFGLARNTVKLGIMDEERRTSLNLAACVDAAKDRLVFLNTGFLDRTGDEIHSCMAAGPMQPKEKCKEEPWYQAYECSNVAVGLSSGLAPGKGQIGKGMWAKTDEMREMLVSKKNHPEAGASTAWVPSPTAAVLHALHYHQVDVPAMQRKLQQEQQQQQGHSGSDGGSDGGSDEEKEEELRDKMLHPPLLARAATRTAFDAELVEGFATLPRELVLHEVDTNCQAILGYVARWVQQGVGCSKVPNLEGVQLMEDRATLRIASQALANWLHHGVVSKEDVQASLLRMAKVVDGQNANDKGYTAMGPDPKATSVAFHAALDLVLKGVQQPGGYTEETLTKRRLQVKADGPTLLVLTDHVA